MDWIVFLLVFQRLLKLALHFFVFSPWWTPNKDWWLLNVIAYIVRYQRKTSVSCGDILFHWPPQPEGNAADWHVVDEIPDGFRFRYGLSRNSEQLCKFRCLHEVLVQAIDFNNITHESLLNLLLSYGADLGHCLVWHLIATAILAVPELAVRRNIADIRIINCIWKGFINIC